MTGVLLAVCPTVTPDKERAVLNYMSTVTGWRDPDPPVAGGGRLPAGRETDAAGSDPIHIDRVHMPAQQLAASLRVPLGKPVLLAGLTLSPHEEPSGESEGKERKQLYLVVQTSIAEER